MLSSMLLHYMTITMLVLALIAGVSWNPNPKKTRMYFSLALIVASLLLVILNVIEAIIIGLENLKIGL